jgi:hypothetical protein
VELLVGIGAAWLVASVVLGVTLGKGIRRADTAERTLPQAMDVLSSDRFARRGDDPTAEKRAT